MNQSPPTTYRPPAGAIAIDALFGARLGAPSTTLEGPLSALQNEGFELVKAQPRPAYHRREHLLVRPDQTGTAYVACDREGLIQHVAVAFGGEVFTTPEQGQSIASDLQAWLRRLLGPEHVVLRGRQPSHQTDMAAPHPEAMYSAAWSPNASGGPLLTYSTQEFTEAACALAPGYLRAAIAQAHQGCGQAILCLLTLQGAAPEAQWAQAPQGNGSTRSTSSRP